MAQRVGQHGFELKDMLHTLWWWLLHVNKSTRLAMVSNYWSTQQDTPTQHGRKPILRLTCLPDTQSAC